MGKKGKKMEAKHVCLVRTIELETTVYTDIVEGIEHCIVLNDHKIIGDIKIDDEKLCEPTNAMESIAANEKTNVTDDRKENIQSNTSKVDDRPKEKKREMKKEETFANDESDIKLKKKLKKQRQKERKKSEKADVKENTKEVIKTCTEEPKDLKGSHKIAKPPKEDDSYESEEIDSDEEHNKNEDIDFVNNVPAFVSTALKKSNIKPVNAKPEKTIKKVTPVESKNIVSEEYNATPNDFVECCSENGDDNFTYVKGKRTKSHSNVQQLSECCATKAIEFIMENKIPLAIKYLSEAIRQDSSQIQHYVNRSFCYLRSEEYSLAFTDAQHAVQNSPDTKVLTKAKYVLAQAFCGIKNYEYAEKNLEECLRLAPQDNYLQRELLRIRVMQLMSLGFPERDAIYALKDCSNLLDAVELLSKKCTSNEGSHFCTQKNTSCIYGDNEIYYSDDDDENYSNTLLLSTIAHRTTMSGAIRKNRRNK